MDYLHECLGFFREFGKRYYGHKEGSIRAIERAAQEIRSRRQFSYEDMECILQRQIWDPRRFWRFPSREEFNAGDGLRGLDLWHLPKKEQQTIAKLLAVFKHVEPVSVVLSFIAPEHYGVLSPPVEKLLEVRRGTSDLDTYLNYLSDLREIQEARRFDRVIDVDRALWVLQEAYLRRRVSGHQRFEQAFRDDPDLQAIRARNLVAELFRTAQPKQLAQALRDCDPCRSAQFGGLEFERLVRELGQIGIGGSPADSDLFEAIDGLFRRKCIDGVIKAQWHLARKVRNRAVHGSRPPTTKELRILLSAIEDAESMLHMARTNGAGRAGKTE